ncbi:putative ORFan [Tupanvirus deep ocean]|uniref:ORFan n=2 Tax=Tupanvirus TaxID=2094720 RepID=A0AC62A7B3_9VIRU|nr:putative ORFan [Tupanvirus deep ocean]QKU33659.1 putative ORFan [Tupanvirus deep ocean]
MLLKEFIDAFKKLKLDVIHPIFKKRITTCGKKFNRYMGHKNGTLYGRFVGEFIIAICDPKYKNLSHNDAVEKIFSRVNPCMKIYYQNEINFFVAPKFLTNFCQTNIENIMDAFSFANGMTRFNKYQDKNNCVLEICEVKKVFDILLMMLLAKIFCMICVCQNIAIEEKLTFKSTLSYINDYVPSLESMSVEHINNDFSTKSNSTEKKILLNLINKYGKKLEQSFSDENKIVSDFQNNPELFAILCDNDIVSNLLMKIKNEKITMKKISHSFFSCKNFLYLLYVLYDSNECEKQLPDLKLKIHNIESYIEIEI